ncbi:hypothetical protein E2C01_046077 [Portunus trituberculatus]|uniref:HTH psq-type domain-containing protein n=1 Tax=Portunus trituberculatus TaxID=210409 RepID=A0A5B7G441_PORTR|nr:hypothetical protein [Portunus trituberculatus]
MDKLFTTAKDKLAAVDRWGMWGGKNDLRRQKATSSPSPKKHNFLSFKDKLDLIRKCEAGIAHSVIAVQMGVPRSTVSTIWKNSDKYRETAAILLEQSHQHEGVPTPTVNTLTFIITNAT